MSKHTKGKWKTGDNFTVVWTENNENICTIMNYRNKWNPVDKEELEANARLIAKAPALLEACKEAHKFILKNIELTPEKAEIMDNLTKLIAQAEGESNE